MITELINKKENNIEWTELEITSVVNDYVNDKISDSEMTDWLKCICKYDMTDNETLALTKAQLNSGEIMDLSSIKGIKVDKHSTGGVGDKATLVIAPIVAACEVPVAKMSGRALGWTGGTIDKLESIPGFNTNLTIEQFINQVNEIGLAITAQTADLAPADKKIYALRDVTNTVQSIPLITASIMSKKLASGADKIVLEVTCGNGAFCKTLEEARLLATKMVNIGNLYGKETIALITDMNEPLGNALGNGVEVKEAMDCLSNCGPSEVTELCLIFASHMVALAKNISLEEAEVQTKDALLSGKAYQKFLDLVKNQGGDLSSFNLNYPQQAILSKKAGYISHIDTDRIGYLLISLGAGRNHKEDQIDHQVGVVLHKKIGDHVNTGEPILSIINNEIIDFEIEDYITVTNVAFEKPPLIYETIGR